MRKLISDLVVRSVREDERTLTGIATTPTLDRQGDIIDPLGLTFPARGVPLLLGHDQNQPIGSVTFDKPTRAGVTFKAHIPRVDEPGPVKDRLDGAWQSVKLGLLKSVSIGFRSLENAVERLPTGLKFLKAEILELSLVAIPAQPDAVILAAKANASGPTARTVKLTARDVAFGKMMAEAEEREARRRRLGIIEPHRTVKLPTPLEIALAEGEALLRRLEQRGRH